VTANSDPHRIFAVCHNRIPIGWFACCSRSAKLGRRMSYPNLPASVSTSGSSKLPIPRLHKQRSEPPRRPPVNRQNRVSRACLSCRSRKIKCNGQQPQCSNCSESATSCVYASSRKDRLKTCVPTSLTNTWSLNAIGLLYRIRI
jgi:hypothetical protein